MNHPPTPPGLADEMCLVEEITYWSLPMCMAWIIWRQMQTVRETCKDYCDNSSEWKSLSGIVGYSGTSQSKVWQPMFGLIGYLASASSCQANLLRPSPSSFTCA